MQSSTIEFYRNSLDYISSVQNEDGSIPWEFDKKLDPWDHIEAAMGLSRHLIEPFGGSGPILCIWPPCGPLHAHFTLAPEAQSWHLP